MRFYSSLNGKITKAAQKGSLVHRVSSNLDRKWLVRDLTKKSNIYILSPCAIFHVYYFSKTGIRFIQLEGFVAGRHCVNPQFPVVA